MKSADQVLCETVTGPPRILGHDLARGLAVVMMIFINFNAILPGADLITVSFSGIIDLLERRAAVILVMVSGVGLSLMSRASNPDTAAGSLPVRLKKQIVSRSLFLVVLGYLLSMVWSGDILHFYGIFLFTGMFLLSKKSKTLLYAILLCWFINAIQHIDLIQVFLEESDLILVNPVKDILFTGYFPVFPWMVFFLVGMLMGRVPLQGLTTQTAMLISGLLLMTSEALFANLSGPLEYTIVLSGVSDSIPFSVLSGIGTGVLAILTGSLLSNLTLFRKNTLLTLLGKTSLTLYVLHILFFCLVIMVSKMLGFRLSMMPAITLFLILYVIFIRLWLNSHPKGPLETLMRKFDPTAGSPKASVAADHPHKKMYA
ncbi:MAG: DUF1624 domain-containing protein [Desulfobacter sp.]|nr:MAG: DUF1624 domain-containing protein [Desulfobacter sp.]